MGKVTGIGGIFFKCLNSEHIREWYQKNLGLNCEDYGTSFIWREAKNPDQVSHTVWGTFEDNTTYFQPSKKDFMINFRVDDLLGLLAQLKENGVEIIGSVVEQPYGKFAQVIDPEGNKIELWEANDQEYSKIINKTTPC